MVQNLHFSYKCENWLKFLAFIDTKNYFKWLVRSLDESVDTQGW
jgi:hypothetical protein